VSDEWHLPKFMRDFHDQKDVFRAISDYDRDHLRTEDERKRHPAPNWTEAHVYTVDVFLRFMAEHGYTLQRCRKDVEFKDVDDTVGKSRNERMAGSAAVLQSMFKGQ
jgi:hypothetical protein